MPSHNDQPPGAKRSSPSGEVRRPGVTNEKPFGPFSPGQQKSSFFALFADDCLLHFKQSEFNEKQRIDHESNIALTAMLQVALIYMGREQDHAALHDRFLEEPWRDALKLYHHIFSTLFDSVIPESHLHYAPRDGFYEALAERDLPGELLSLYMISGSNLSLHKSPAAWELSKQVNSKMHFAATAPEAGLPTPATRVFTKASLPKENGAFDAAYPNGAMLKLQGLAGARNVTKVSSLTDAKNYLADYDADTELLLQDVVNTDLYTEMTVDLHISDTEIRITNVRKILFADGLWVGNYISPDLNLSAHQESVCLQVGDYVRRQGYKSVEGYNCGIDFFVAGDDIQVIEINARWTGGLFPTQLIDRLDAWSEHSVAFIDTVTQAALPAYLNFLSDHYTQASAETHGFRVVPMGFSPFTQEIEGKTQIFVWQVVMGDFSAFTAAKTAYAGLGPNELSTANLIRLS